MSSSDISAVIAGYEHRCGLRRGSVEAIQFVHLWGGRGPRARWPLPHGGGEVGHALAAHALEVHVSALALLLLPGHVDERPLHIVVNYL